LRHLLLILRTQAFKQPVFQIVLAKLGLHHSHIPQSETPRPINLVQHRLARYLHLPKAILQVSTTASQHNWSSETPILAAAHCYSYPGRRTVASYQNVEDMVDETTAAEG